MNRYLPIFGPNTKQWWVYDEDLDVYIDPPASVLENIAKVKPEKQGEYLKTLVNIEPSPKWLHETEYHYTELEP